MYLRVRLEQGSDMDNDHVNLEKHVLDLNDHRQRDLLSLCKQDRHL
jgi:hypothetical protein